MGADLIENYEGEDKLNSYAFNILSQVEAPRNSPNDGTHWSIVFDSKNTVVYYKTLNNRGIRTINLKNLDFNCTNDFKALSIIESKPENIYSQFKSFTPKENIKMFKDGVKVFLKRDKLPFFISKSIERVANIPYKYDFQ